MKHLEKPFHYKRYSGVEIEQTLDPRRRIMNEHQSSNKAVFGISYLGIITDFIGRFLTLHNFKTTLKPTQKILLLLWASKDVQNNSSKYGV